MKRHLSPILLSALALLVPGTAEATVARSGVTTPVGAGGAHTCVINQRGNVKCWGANDAGQSLPPYVPGEAYRVSAGARHTCTASSYRGSHLVCWGDNSAGQRNAPGLYGDWNVFEIAAGARHTCGLWLHKRAGTHHLECWGFGQPADPGVGKGPFSKLVAGTDFSCIRTGRDEKSWRAACWGDNRHGQLDVPPVTIPGNLGAGARHACGVTYDAVLCWGDDSSGQAGTHPGAFKSVDGGDDFTCAVRVDDTLTCWGADTGGQTTPPAGTFRHESLSVGDHHGCAARVEDSVVVCWGDTAAGPPPPG